MPYFTDISLIICNQPVIRIRTVICNTAPKYANHLADSKRDHKNKQQQCKYPKGKLYRFFFTASTASAVPVAPAPPVLLCAVPLLRLRKKAHKRIPKTDIRLFLIRCRCNIYYIPAFMVIVNFNQACAFASVTSTCTTPVSVSPR